jgi:amino acid transporter
MRSALARSSLRGQALWVMDVSASAPMTVLAGAVVTTFAATGLVGLPLAFLALTAALWLLTIGYVAVGRHVVHAAPFYAVLAHGLGRFWGMCGAALALLGYNAIQISLYGLLGASLAGLFGGPWWAWAAAAWVAVGAAGVLRIRVGATLVAVLMLCEVTVIVIFIFGAFTGPTGGAVSVVPLQPAALLQDGVGGVLAFSVACFVGYESSLAYSEEAREGSAAGRATLAALLFLGVFYAVAAWAVTLAVGPDRVVDAARSDPSLVMTVIAESTGAFGPLLASLTALLLVTSILAAMLSFHGTVSRYVFALARERVLPAVLASTGRGSRQDAPVGGSLLQSAIATLVVVPFVLAGADPVVTMFTWLAALAAAAVLLLLVTASAAAWAYFHRGGGAGETAWATRVAPILGITVGLVVLGTIVSNLDTLLGIDPRSRLTWLIPLVLAATVAVGATWAVVLRLVNRDVYDNIGRGRPHPLAMPERRLHTVRL